MLSARTRLNELKARRVHVADAKDAAAEFLYWSDEARELRSNLDWSRRHEDWYEDAVNELERVNKYRVAYLKKHKSDLRLEQAVIRQGAAA